jgi:hypothetical protein
MRNKYFIKEGQEELNRALLMMKYDSNKTLTENVNEISEQSTSDVLKQTATGAAVGAAAGGLGGAGVGAIPGAVIGGIYGLIRGLSGGNAKRSDMIKLINACSTNKKELGKTTLNIDDYDVMSDNINRAITTTWGTDEDAIKTELSKITTIPDLCGFVSNYNESYGNLITDLDGDLEGDSEWREFVFIPLRKAIRNSKTASETKPTENKPKTQQVNTTKSTYNRATADLQQKLYNLGFYIGNTGPAGNGVDGYYGPKTKLAETSWKNGDTCSTFNQRNNYPNPETCKSGTATTGGGTATTGGGTATTGGGTATTGNREIVTTNPNED